MSAMHLNGDNGQKWNLKDKTCRKWVNELEIKILK